MRDPSSFRITPLAVVLFLLATQSFAQPTFVNKIPIPPLYDVPPNGINLEMRVTRHKYDPANPGDTLLNGSVNQPNGLTAFAYNVAGSSAMSLLGPTLKIHTYSQAKINVKNLLGTPTTTHWHGMELPPMMDGGPHSPIAPGATWSVNFTVIDSACTMWYHPHFHDRTLPQVQMGLSGMIIVEQLNDPIRDSIPHTYGVDDIPVIIGDLGTAYDPIYGVVNVDTFKASRPYNIVNGVTNPYFEVPAHIVRLRILNGSTRKGIIFGISNGYKDSLQYLKPFYLIGTDGGYTIKPDTLKTLLNGPGARDEILLDLSSYPIGSTLYLRNLKQLLPNSVVGSTLQAPPPGMGGQDATSGDAFLQLRIVPDPPGYTPVKAFKSFTTVWSPGLADTNNIARSRLKKLTFIQGNGSNIPNAFTFDTMTYKMGVINDTVCVGTKEIWTIWNTTKVAHPFHIHKIQFRILDIDSLGHQINLEARGLNGPKDDVLVFPNWKLRFLGQFDDYPSPIDSMYGYMYHCHILTHEDAVGGGMMHQFVVAKSPNCTGVVGVDTEGDRPSMVLFPNPTDGTLYLKGQSPTHSTVSIFDLHGRRLRKQDFHSIYDEAEIDINGLSNGMYLVEWQTKMGVATGKLVIQR